MKSIFTIIFIMLSILNGYGQSILTADAGPDKYWCRDMIASGTDTPRLGGLNVASSGVPPYTYQWSFRIGQNVTSGRYIDSPAIAHPHVNEVPYSPTAQNTCYAILKVKDANGAEAKDSATIFFQWGVVSPGTSSTFKTAYDTISIAAGGGDQFPPYHGYKWWPSTGLMDTTVARPRCFISSFAIYHNSYFDSVGCSLCCGEAIIEIRPAASVSSLLSSPAPVSVFALPGRTLVVEGKIDETATLLLYDANGKKVFEQVLISSQNRWKLPAEIAEGIYLYKISIPGTRPLSGKVSIY